MSKPLYQAKAEFFKALAHPARIRVLELLSVREHSVGEMLPEVGLESAHLSQQLAVLRKMNLVVARRTARPSTTPWSARRSPNCSPSPGASSPRY
ncbi:ArsR/SmtB family transcription factor [Catellatospora coxensis]